MEWIAMNSWMTISIGGRSYEEETSPAPNDKERSPFSATTTPVESRSPKRSVTEIDAIFPRGRVQFGNKVISISTPLERS